METEFFNDIIYELHEGIPFTMYEIQKRSDIGHANCIVVLIISLPYKLCNMFAKGLESNKYVPHTKPDMVRRHAANLASPSRRQYTVLQ